MSRDFDWAGVVDYARRHPAEPPRTQYELPGVTEEMHQGVPVAVVPLWHAVVTARLAFPASDRDHLRLARHRLDAALAEAETVYPLGPGGIFIQVAYWLPYFRERIPGKLVDEHMPRAMMPGTEGQWAVIESIRFPKDPADVVLENHEVCFHFKSDYRDQLRDYPRLHRSHPGLLLRRRRRDAPVAHRDQARGVVRLYAGTAAAPDVPSAPHRSSGGALPGPGARVVVRAGTGRRRAAARAGRSQRADAVPVPGQAGDHHRLRSETAARHGVLPAAGLRHRGEPVRILAGRRGPRPAASGRALIGFGPSAQHFEKMRLEMDGTEHQQRHNLPEENVGFTKMLVTTHRQNFLLPPRAHPSMPLAEML